MTAPYRKKLMEVALPLKSINEASPHEKSIRHGHPSTLHLWWARRPLAACRAAVYGALVPASQFVPENGPDNKKQSLGRANAARFVTELRKYPGSPRAIAEAQKHILDTHAGRLTAELAEAARTGQWPAWVDEFKWPKGEKQVTRHDIEKGRASWTCSPAAAPFRSRPSVWAARRTRSTSTPWPTSSCSARSSTRRNTAGPTRPPAA